VRLGLFDVTDEDHVDAANDSGGQVDRVPRLEAMLNAKLGCAARDHHRDIDQLSSR